MQNLKTLDLVHRTHDDVTEQSSHSRFENWPLVNASRYREKINNGDLRTIQNSSKYEEATLPINEKRAIEQNKIIDRRIN